MSMAIGAKSRAEINMTPMIDVLLVLIIIFMVITPIAPRGLQAVVPPRDDSAVTHPEPSRDIVINVARDGSLEINQQAVQAPDLPARLADLYGRHVNDHVFVRGDRSLNYETVAHVIDIARGAGFDRVGLMTW
jgi:biopolymer transport protein TolR